MVAEGETNSVWGCSVGFEVLGCLPAPCTLAKFMSSCYWSFEV